MFNISYILFVFLNREIHNKLTSFILLCNRTLNFNLVPVNQLPPVPSHFPPVFANHNYIFVLYELICFFHFHGHGLFHSMTFSSSHVVVNEISSFLIAFGFSKQQQKWSELCSQGWRLTTGTGRFSCTEEGTCKLYLVWAGIELSIDLSTVNTGLSSGFNKLIDKSAGSLETGQMKPICIYTNQRGQVVSLVPLSYLVLRGLGWQHSLGFILRFSSWSQAFGSVTSSILLASFTQFWAVASSELVCTPARSELLTSLTAFAPPLLCFCWKAEELSGIFHLPGSKGTWIPCILLVYLEHPEMRKYKVDLLGFFHHDFRENILSNEMVSGLSWITPNVLEAQSSDWLGRTVVLLRCFPTATAHC